MHFTSLSTLLSTLSLSSLLTVPLATAQLITSDTHSFGGVNYPLLQYLDPPYRDEAIRAIVKSKARVIRLFIRPDTHHSDPEPQIGEFDKSLLDQLDDALAAIHRISNGTVKVILAPHDARALRGTEGVPCDAYCEKIGGAFLDFYSSEEIRKLYKTRLDVFFKHYPSKNFRGRSWSTLSEVILGVDVQHAPFTPIFPIPAGESWLCDMATHLSSSLALKKSNIAVISGGVSGHMSSPDDIRNMPDSVWGFEEWEYVDAEGGVERKREDIYDQGMALNLRGVPWLYSHLSPRPADNTSRINPLPASQPSNASLTTSTSADASAFSALAHLLRRAHTARSTFDWTRFLPAPAVPLAPLSLKEIPLNPGVMHDAHTASRPPVPQQRLCRAAGWTTRPDGGAMR
ncbi:hypothetical protein E8E13_011229 [Curvularia kusanoi]|uniref:Uncharacterized protein n=1 Tax=Curvularia kusanoi TaxID=90978 RepID=A0A9P4TLS8_CURKU|nr:hypothetical protein E8E13_011229 [Curvularia kusanoi]